MAKNTTMNRAGFGCSMGVNAVHAGSLDTVRYAIMAQEDGVPELASKWLLMMAAERPPFEDEPLEPENMRHV